MIVPPDGVHQGDLLLPVALHSGLELLQIQNMFLGCGALRLQGRFLGFQGGDLPGHLCRGLCGGGLTALQAGNLLPGLGKLLGVDLNLCPLGGKTLPVGAVPLADALLLPPGGFLRLDYRVQQNFILLFLALEPEHLILRRAKLIPGGGELKFHLVKLALGLLKLRLQYQLFLLQALFLPGELFQLIGPGENARVLVHGTTGHGAAGVHHLAVQGNDLKAAAIALAHGNGRVQVGHDHGSRQQVFHNAPVLFLAFYQVRGNAHKAPAAFQAVFLEGSSLDAA